ncbi:trigger factor [Alkaliphilus sp. MSJ-5]|uniref:Trigger factor n=1 Tax=Alkaliphilus flagellatus TaxID=2841507 RepID=A0ABS6G752_9FIRM|nr:trigger factor [Alkaliphilus flagellatus]MBU5677221.1 trigger factor [Alkaliphilus flagellatus]
MSSEIIKKENTKVTLKVVVEAAQFEEAINKAYNKMKSRFNIQGFRKGKAPKKIVERYYGVEVFYEEAFNIAFPAAYEAALKEHNIDPVDHPEIDIEDIKANEDVVFTAVVEVMPEFEVKDYKGIEVEKKEYNVQEEDIQKELDALVEKNARMIAVEDRAVKEQDMVIIDYKGMVDGVAFEGGTAERQSLTIGSGQFIPGFEEQLVGKNIGDEVEVKVTFPEEYHAEELAGQDAIFEVKIHEIKEKELPVLDDEFAKDASEFDTLEELKNDIKNSLEENAKNRAEQDLRNSVIEAIASKVDIEIPKAVIQRQIDNMLADFDYRLQYQGLNLQYYFQLTGTKEEDLRDQMRADATQTVKNELVLEQIGKYENIVATDEELNEQLEKMAAQYNQELEKLKSNLRDQDLNSIKEGIVIRKTIDFLVENAKIA